MTGRSVFELVSRLGPGDLVMWHGREAVMRAVDPVRCSAALELPSDQDRVWADKSVELASAAGWQLAIGPHRASGWLIVVLEDSVDGWVWLLVLDRWAHRVHSPLTVCARCGDPWPCTEVQVLEALAMLEFETGAESMPCTACGQRTAGLRALSLPDGRRFHAARRYRSCLAAGLAAGRAAGLVLYQERDRVGGSMVFFERVAHEESCDRAGTPGCAGCSAAFLRARYELVEAS